MSEERGQYEIEPIESIEQIEQEIQEINEPDNACDVGEQFGGFVSYHKGLSDQADAHMYDDRTLVIYDSSRKRVTLDATEAWNLFAFLESQKDQLWSNMRGKPADISFLEMEDQQGIYRIAEQDESAPVRQDEPLHLRAGAGDAAINEQLLEIARREIAQCRVEGMDEEDTYFMACGALLSHGRKTGIIGEDLSNEMADAIRVLVQEAMNTEAQP